MYYFIGIKGSGMASLACILKDQGYEVAGSDIEKYIFTQESLLEKAIPFYHFDAQNIKDGMQVIIGNAFDETHVEVRAALNNPTVETFTYPAFLGKMLNAYESICVSGTHGKTNTTGMLSHLFNEQGRCGYLIGDGSGYMPQDATHFVLESCEYKRNFLNYKPDYAIILNIELDHVDYYKGLEDYLDAFETFANGVKKGVVVFGDEDNTKAISIQVPHLYYGMESSNDVYASNVVEDASGVHFDCIYKGQLFGHFDLALYGEHLLWNALGCIALGILNGLSYEMILKGLQSFQGVKRRFSIEEVGNTVYIDDYAHHPTAIALTIKAAKQKYPKKEIVAFFKPDRYSRIAYFLEEFKTAFDEADVVYLFDFPKNAQKEDGIDISIVDLLKAVPQAKLIEETQIEAESLLKHGEACYLFMSSKDIYKFKDMMKNFQNNCNCLQFVVE